jgi:hypothetical protein
MEADRTPLAGRDERAPSDEPGAHQRRGRDRIIECRELERVSRVCEDVRREPAITRVSREQRIVAEILAARTAIEAMPAGVSKPRDSDALTHGEAGTLSPTASTMPTIS